MKLSDIIRRVQRQFGDESGAQITTADIIDWANDGQLDIARKTEVLADLVAFNSVAQQRQYSLPDDFLKLRKVAFEGRTLDPTSMETVDSHDKFASGASDGVPVVYYLWGTALFLHPPPPSNKTNAIEIHYVKMPPVLTEADLNVEPELPRNFHEDIVRYCLGRAKELDEEDAKAQEIMTDLELRLAQSKDDAWSPDVDSYPSIRLLPGDY